MVEEKEEDKVDWIKVQWFWSKVRGEFLKENIFDFWIFFEVFVKNKKLKFSQKILKLKIFQCKNLLKQFNSHPHPLSLSKWENSSCQHCKIAFLFIFNSHSSHLPFSTLNTYLLLSYDKLRTFLYRDECEKSSFIVNGMLLNFSSSFNLSLSNHSQIKD